MKSEKEFLSLEEVAEILGVTYRLIYKLVRSGELPAMRIGKLYRLSRRDLDNYLEKSRQPNMIATQCSVCGRSYHSRMSLPHQCEECETPICVDCWERGHVRRCREHQAK